eukprot:265861_1
MSHSTFDSYDSTQIHTFSHIFHDTLNITKTEIHTYLAPYHLYPLDTFGLAQAQTHTSIEYDPTASKLTLTYLHISHSTFDSYGSPQTRTFSHILHDTFGITKTEIHTYLPPDSQYLFNTFGSLQYLILVLCSYCYQYSLAYLLLSTIICLFFYYQYLQIYFLVQKVVKISDIFI